jgi:hypothetical protein
MGDHTGDVSGDHGIELYQGEAIPIDLNDDGDGSSFAAQFRCDLLSLARKMSPQASPPLSETLLIVAVVLIAIAFAIAAEELVRSLWKGR